LDPSGWSLVKTRQDIEVTYEAPIYHVQLENGSHGTNSWGLFDTGRSEAAQAGERFDLIQVELLQQAPARVNDFDPE